MRSDGGGERWIIEGVMQNGDKFRPSDWIERISTSLATFGRDQRLRYDHEVQPCVLQGEKCLVVGKGLATRAPLLFAYIMRFAEENQLRIQEQRCSVELPVSVECRGQE